MCNNSTAVAAADHSNIIGLISNGTGSDVGSLGTSSVVILKKYQVLGNKQYAVSYSVKGQSNTCVTHSIAFMFSYIV